MIEDHRVTQFSLSLTRFHLFASANLHPRLQTMEKGDKERKCERKDKDKYKDKDKERKCERKA